MELKYPEMRCRTIIENHLRPLLNEGKYEELIGRFFETIHDTHSPVEQEVKQKPIFFPDPDNGVIFEIPKNSRAE